MEYKDSVFDVIVVGAGPSGIGVSSILKDLGLNYIILEKDSIGSSFRQWPEETKFISPSFTGNFFKMPDLNAISPDTSPAFKLLTEHPSGKEFQEYLESFAWVHQLKIETGIEVLSVEEQKELFIVKTNKQDYIGQYIIWAAGEYQYPKTDSFEGSSLCMHYSAIDSFAQLEGDDYIVIGSYESGLDCTINLANLGKSVTLFDGDDYLDLVNSDSSYSLAPFTRDRLKTMKNRIKYYRQTRIRKVEFDGDMYSVLTSNGSTFMSQYQPIDCTGFEGSTVLVKELFEFNNGYPLLNEFDESIKTENLFLVGPQVKHKDALFCFIYKYRQRFAVVAERIAQLQGISSDTMERVLKEYKENNFYLDDFSCCEGECKC